MGGKGQEEIKMGTCDQRKMMVIKVGIGEVVITDLPSLSTCFSPIYLPLLLACFLSALSLSCLLVYLPIFPPTTCYSAYFFVDVYLLTCLPGCPLNWLIPTYLPDFLLDHLFPACLPSCFHTSVDCLPPCLCAFSAYPSTFLPTCQPSILSACFSCLLYRLPCLLTDLSWLPITTSCFPCGCLLSGVLPVSEIHFCTFYKMKEKS